MGFALGWIRVTMDGLCFGLDQARDRDSFALGWIGGVIKGLN